MIFCQTVLRKSVFQTSATSANSLQYPDFRVNITNKPMHCGGRGTKTDFRKSLRSQPPFSVVLYSGGSAEVGCGSSPPYPPYIPQGWDRVLDPTTPGDINPIPSALVMISL